MMHMENQTNTAREYAAFISYRHCPLDIRVAEELQKQIEHYRVPKDLRGEGGKGLGLVFRDRDELPLSNDLTESIYTALDHAQWLIVVCTPETPKSGWVEQEIRYFIEKHGRRRILTVLAAGTMEESVPKIITNIYDTDGETVLQKTEPHCAYLVAESEKKVLKNLKKEFLRLAAAILDCHYDALIQRQKRYRAQQIMAGAIVLAVLALLFVGMLVNRNQQITRKNQEILEKNDEIQLKNEEIAQQLLQTQINETKALTLLSRQQLSEGDRIGAMESALNALPHDGDNRPYNAAAESALADALNIYNPMMLDYHMVATQKGEVCRLTLSDDGKYLVTLDTGGVMRCFDTWSSAMLWESSVPEADWESIPNYDLLWDAYTDNSFIQCFEVVDTQNIVMYSGRNATHAFSLETGELLRSAPFCTARLDSGRYFDNKIAISADGKYFVQYSQPYAQDVGLGEEPEEETQPEEESDSDQAGGIELPTFPVFDVHVIKEQTHYLEVYETETFQSVRAFPCDWPEAWDASAPAFSLDGSRLAIAFSNVCVELLVLDTKTWEVVYQPVIETAKGEFAFNTYLVWLPDNELLLSYEQRDTSEKINTYLEKFSKDGTSVSAGPYYAYLPSAYSLEPSHELSDNRIYYNLGNEYINIVDLSTLERTASRDQQLAGTYLREDGSLMTVELEGSVYCRYDGDTKYSSYIYQPDRKIRIAAGVSGEREVLCLVPDSNPYTVIIVTEPHLQEFVSVEALPMEEYGSKFGFVQYMDFVPSPSGEELFAIDQVDHEADIFAVTGYDTRTMEITGWKKLEGTNYLALYVDSFSGFSADESKMFFRGMVYDCLTGTLSDQEQGEKIYGESRILVDYPPFYNQSAGKPLLSAYVKNGELYWWTDGADLKTVTIPYEMETNCRNSNYVSITTIGHNGLFVQPLFETDEDNRPQAFGIYSTEDDRWNLLENKVDQDGFPNYAIGSETKQVTFADMDRMLCVYDWEHNAIIHQWPLSVNVNTIQKMQYIARDRYLMIVTNNYMVHLIDMRDGSELGSYQCDAGLVPYVCGDDLYLKNTSEALRIDLSSGEVIGRFGNLLCVLTVNEREYALCVGPNSQMILMPIYSWEELAEMGWELMALAKSGSQNLQIRTENTVKTKSR